MKIANVLAVVAGLLAASSAFAQQGHEQTEKLIKKAGDTTKSIVEAQQEIQKTLDTYNSIMDMSAKDPRKAYKDVMKGLDNSDKRVEDVRKKIAEMDTEAETLFTDWTASLDAISSDNLRARSIERRDDTKASYEQIHQVAAKAGQGYGSFMQSLRDQLTYLGHDLNPEAIESLKEDAAALGQKGTTLFKDVDTAVSTIRDLTSRLSPQ